MQPLKEIIANRRTVKPDRYTGKTIADEKVWEILKAANWAPTHGHTEPWRFVVFDSKSKHQLLEFLNGLDVELNGANEVKLFKRAKRFETTSHIISLGMKRGDNPKIPELEELLAVATAVQNMWLTAHNLGVGAYWSTGNLAFTKQLAEFMGLDADKDRSLGFLYLGDPVPNLPPGHRLSPIEAKVDWR